METKPEPTPAEVQALLDELTRLRAKRVKEGRTLLSFDEINEKVRGARARGAST